MLNAIEDRDKGNQIKRAGREAVLTRGSFPRAARDGQEDRACAEYRLPRGQRPCDPILRRGDGAREVHHRHEAEKHDAEQGRREPDPNTKNKAEGRGDQGDTNK